MIVSIQAIAGTGSAVPAGPQGLSAYQLWLAAGNSGSAADFLASLVGPLPSPPAQTAAARDALAALIAALPTALPNTAGVLWNNGGVLSLS